MVILGLFWYEVGRIGKPLVLFTGTYERTLDGKTRVLLPKRVKTALKDHLGLFLTPGTDHCLELHTARSLDEMAAEANSRGSRSSKVKAFARLFYAQAESVQLDSQGRLRIPARLAQLAELEKEIAIVGVGTHWEIWDVEKWRNYFSSHMQAFDWVHQTTFDSASVSGTNTPTNPPDNVETTSKPHPK